MIDGHKLGYGTFVKESYKAYIFGGTSTTKHNDSEFLSNSIVLQLHPDWPFFYLDHGKAEVYDLKTGTFASLPDMPLKINSFGFARISETKILIAGGKQHDGTKSEMSFVYDIPSKTYTTHTIPDWSHGE